MSNINSENNTVKYKRELSESFERSVVAFLNSTGGHIYVGVKDDGSAYGIKEMDKVQRQIADRILNNIRPNAIGLFNVIAEEQDGKDVVHVVVSGGLEWLSNLLKLLLKVKMSNLINDMCRWYGLK